MTRDHIATSPAASCRSAILRCATNIRSRTVTVPPHCGTSVPRVSRGGQQHRSRAVTTLDIGRTHQPHTDHDHDSNEPAHESVSLVYNRDIVKYVRRGRWCAQTVTSTLQRSRDGRRFGSHQCWRSHGSCQNIIWSTSNQNCSRSTEERTQHYLDIPAPISQSDSIARISPISSTSLLHSSTSFTAVDPPPPQPPFRLLETAPACYCRYCIEPRQSHGHPSLTRYSLVRLLQTHP